MTELLDARGVVVEAGDTVIYGFGVSRSVAMAEGVVVTQVPEHGPATVSLTASGRVRLRVVRRSFDSGEKPVVDVAPDRLVVLKASGVSAFPVLPPSPLPTQAEEARKAIESAMLRYTEMLRADEVPSHWIPAPMASAEVTLGEYHEFCARQLKELRKKLRALDE